MGTNEESVFEGQSPIAWDEQPTEKSNRTKKRNSPNHRPYFEMIKEAITALKERTGSSQYAIAKFIEEKEKNLPRNFRKLLLVQLKKFVANGKLVKFKNSYKLPSAKISNAAVKPKAETPVNANAKVATKRKAPEKPKSEKKPHSKVAKMSAKSTAGKKTTSAAPAKRVKPKTVKAPAKKASTKN